MEKKKVEHVGRKRGAHKVGPQSGRLIFLFVAVLKHSVKKVPPKAESEHIKLSYYSKLTEIEGLCSDFSFAVFGLLYVLCK